MPATTHRSYQAVVLVLLGVVVGLLLPKALPLARAGDPGTVPQVVRANRFELASPDGKKAAELAWGTFGPSLTLYAPTGNPSIDLRVVGDHQPQVLINNGEGKMVMNFQLDVGGKQPAISFFDGATLRAKVGVGPLGHAILALSGKERAMRAVVAVAEDGTPLFEAYDKSEKSIWKAP
jgi:hypothetical protein